MEVKEQEVATETVSKGLPSKNVAIRITNNTGEVLILTDSNINHGKWRDGSPLQMIPNGSVGLIEAGRKTGATIGPEGDVTYSNPEGNIAFTLFFHNPYSGDNTAKIDTVGAYESSDFDWNLKHSPLNISVTITKS